MMKSIAKRWLSMTMAALLALAGISTQVVSVSAAVDVSQTATKEVTAILVGEKNGDYDRFVKLAEMMGLKVKLVKQVPIPAGRVLTAHDYNGEVVKDVVSVLEAAGVKQAEWTDWILVEDPRSLFEGVSLTLKDVGGWDGVSYEELPLSRGVEFLGVSSGQTGMHGFVHAMESIAESYFEQPDRFYDLVDIAGTCHIASTAEFSEHLGETVTLDDPRFLNLRGFDLKGNQHKVEGYWPRIEMVAHGYQPNGVDPYQSDDWVGWYDSRDEWINSEVGYNKLYVWWHYAWVVNQYQERASILDIYLDRLRTTSGPTPIPVSTHQPSSWARASVERAMTLGLVTEELTYYQDPTTRAEFARAVVNFLRQYGYDLSNVTPRIFTDTSDRDIGIAAALGITSGTDLARNLFSPDNQITREQAATMLYNVLKLLNAQYSIMETRWVDREDISPWAREATDVMYNARIMNGTSTSSLVFSPQAMYTYEQTIITLLNLWDYTR